MTDLMAEDALDATADILPIICTGIAFVVTGVWAAWSSPGQRTLVLGRPEFSGRFPRHVRRSASAGSDVVEGPPEGADETRRGRSRGGSPDFGPHAAPWDEVMLNVTELPPCPASSSAEKLEPEAIGPLGSLHGPERGISAPTPPSSAILNGQLMSTRTAAGYTRTARVTLCRSLSDTEVPIRRQKLAAARRDGEGKLTRSLSEASTSTCPHNGPSGSRSRAQSSRGGARREVLSVEGALLRACLPPTMSLGHGADGRLAEETAERWKHWRGSGDEILGVDDGERRRRENLSWRLWWRAQQEATHDDGEGEDGTTV